MWWLDWSSRTWLGSDLGADGMIVSVVLREEGIWEIRPLTSFTGRDDDSGGLLPLTEWFWRSLPLTDDARFTDRVWRDWYQDWMLEDECECCDAGCRLIEEMWTRTSFHRLWRRRFLEVLCLLQITLGLMIESDVTGINWAFSSLNNKVSDVRDCWYASE